MNGKAPDAFRTISEVADWLGVNTHVLRFWESKFSQVKPVKRAGGRRYYRPSDMELLGGIQKLLHEDGMTIKGVQKILREQGIRAVCAMSRPLDAEMGAEPATETPDADHEAPVHEPVVEISADTEPEPDVESAPEYLHLAGASVSMDAAQSNGSAHGAGTTETPRAAREEIAPVAEPAEDPAPETDAVQLFAHRETPRGETPESVDTTPVEVAAGPVIAPLPGADLTVAEALERLVPLQVRPELLRPIHAKLVALRGRMDSAG